MNESLEQMLNESLEQMLNESLERMLNESVEQMLIQAVRWLDSNWAWLVQMPEINFPATKWKELYFVVPGSGKSFPRVEGFDPGALEIVSCSGQ
jgi:hypothetical protein